MAANFTIYDDEHNIALWVKQQHVWINADYPPDASVMYEYRNVIAGG